MAKTWPRQPTYYLLLLLFIIVDFVNRRRRRRRLGRDTGRDSHTICGCRGLVAKTSETSVWRLVLSMAIGTTYRMAISGADETRDWCR